MPKQIDQDFDFSRRRKVYDFSEWADGTPWEFIWGDDYKVTGDTFLAHAKEWAKKNDYNLEHKIIPAVEPDQPEKVVLRFTGKFGGGFDPGSAG